MGVPLPIELTGVSFVYGEASPAATPAAPALSNVSLTVHPGEYLCVLGANGSGKSTLLSLMGNLDRPTTGTIRLFGEDPSTPAGAAALRGRIAMVFQHPDDQMVTSIVADDVAFGPENLGVPQPQIVTRVNKALAAVNMTEYAQADPADLSGGQCQRVAIAGALALQPHVLLLDEPAAMLDVSGRQAIQHIIARLHRQGTTIVHVTHFMDDALAATRVIVMEHGRIALDGTPQDIFCDPVLMQRLGLELPFCMRLRDTLAHADARFTALPVTADPAALARAVAQTLPAAASAPEAPLAPTASTPNTPTPGASAALHFDQVSFSYAEAHNARRKPSRLSRLLGRAKRAQPRPTGHAPRTLDQASFTVPAGSLTALIGATGAGKSTTVELACALKLPLEGTITVAGIPTSDLARRAELRHHIGYVSQFPERQLFAETVFDDVAFGPRNLHLAEPDVRERVLTSLKTLGMPVSQDFLNRSPFALSGGQQRSVAIAGVIAMQPSMLVLDEPMAGLDPTGRQRMRDFIVTLRARGTTILMVTHDMDDVAELADHVVVLEHGRVVQEGTPRQVFSGTVAPGAPSAQTFAELLGNAGAHLTPTPLTLADLAREVVAYGAAR